MPRVDNFTPSLGAQILAKGCCKKSSPQKLANLGMKPLYTGLIALLGLLGLACKASRNQFFSLLLPLGNLIWVHAILIGYLRQYLFPGPGIQDDAVLNSAVNFPLDLDIKSLLGLLTSTLAHGPVFRIHFYSSFLSRSLSALVPSECACHMAVGCPLIKNPPPVES